VFAVFATYYSVAFVADINFIKVPLLLVTAE